MADLTPQQFAAAVLKRLGIHQTPGAIQAIVGWERAEGGHWHNDARYNPLNTTQNMPGSGDTGSQGNISVYRNWQQGVEATARTLRNGNYGGILHALQAGNPAAVANAIDRSPWGTHGPLVHNAILGTARQAGVHAPSLGGTSPAATPHATGSSGGSTRTVTTTTPGVDNRVARASLIQSFLSDQHADPVDFALQARQLQDIAPTTSTKTTRTPGTTQAASSPSSSNAAAGAAFAQSHSPLLELIHNTGSGPGFGVKDGKKVNGSQVFSSVWAGHRTHVHVAAGPKTVVALGKLAQRMGLHVGENSHFGGVSPVHVPGSYHYKDEAIDVSGDPQKMNEYSRRVESLYGIR